MTRLLKNFPRVAIPGGKRAANFLADPARLDTAVTPPNEARPLVRLPALLIEVVAVGPQSQTIATLDFSRETL
jgi:hypothetical protein